MDDFATLLARGAATILSASNLVICIQYVVQVRLSRQSLQRLPRSAAVQTAVGALWDVEHELCCCALSLDEFAFSARSAAEHTEASSRLRTSFLYLPLSPNIDQLILDIRAALWNAGTGRAAGVIDVALAATAVHSAARVLHYDSDFDHIAAAYPRLDAVWVVPRGSID